MGRLMVCLVCVILVQLTYCTIDLTVNPEVITPTNVVPVRIRCRLNLLFSEVVRVYSIMIRRKETTLAVAFTDRKTQMYDKRLKDIAVVNSSLTTPEAYLQLTLPDVTCDDIGDYSCIMAVRTQHSSMNSGSVRVYLKMKGNVCPFMDSLVHPRHKHRPGDLVRVTCFMLMKHETSGWIWSSADNDTVVRSREECASEGEMFNCSSVLLHHVTKSSSLICRLKNFSRSVRIDVTGELPTTDPRSTTFFEEANKDYFRIGEFPEEHNTISEGDGMSWLQFMIMLTCLACEVILVVILQKYWKTIGNRRHSPNKEDHTRNKDNLHQSNCPKLFNTEHKVITGNMYKPLMCSQTSEDNT
ncbi:uncharacterized protein LOC124114559 [Haliotis rufescens]|uniref:uncharacterized protein LOC124114559 n=1 Tax=Haliotis rufescens TaxID=6454 RepID=UPI001EB05680|nr:uncharacterized protein LOC124114559 [Haliotis rufescens]